MNLILDTYFTTPWTFYYYAKDNYNYQRLYIWETIETDIIINTIVSIAGD